MLDIEDESYKSVKKKNHDLDYLFLNGLTDEEREIMIKAVDEIEAERSKIVLDQKKKVYLKYNITDEILSSIIRESKEGSW